MPSASSSINITYAPSRLSSIDLPDAARMARTPGIQCAMTTTSIPSGRGAISKPIVLRSINGYQRLPKSMRIAATATQPAINMFHLRSSSKGSSLTEIQVPRASATARCDTCHTALTPRWRRGKKYAMRMLTHLSFGYAIHLPKQLWAQV